MESHQVDLFEFIDNCDLVVAVPYSSPVYIAQARNKPSIFYDPTGDLIPTYEEHPAITFASGEKELVTGRDMTTITARAAVGIDIQ